jgi:HTH-type transcriptional regulator, transcriptional repressor of NAD biosynthesis genes
MKRGITFGKFMPLHRGHQLLIETALSQVDDLTIVVYDSQPSGEYTSMPIAKRLGWLRALYPNVENIVAVLDPHAAAGDSDDPKYAGEYAEALGFLGRFDIVFTSEPGYDHFANALGCGHVVVDAARELLPVSGTQIREDLYAHRGWMDPLVYSSLIQKVALVGTESTGKSTLARALAQAFETLWVHEFGRELWEAQNLTGTFADHLKVGRRQYEREQAALRHARRYLFCDTTAWTTLHWSLWSYGTADARLIDLVEQTMHDYIWIVCDNDFGWVQDGTREMADGAAARFQAQQIEDLDRRGVGYEMVSGPLERRLGQVHEVLARTFEPPSAVVTLRPWLRAQSGSSSSA